MTGMYLALVMALMRPLMGSGRIALTCGGLSLTGLGWFMSYNADHTLGLILAGGGVILLISALPRTED